MKQVLLALLLVLAISFTGCDITGKSFTVVSGGPGIYLDDASDTEDLGRGRINSHTEDFSDVNIRLYLVAANFDNITGFELVLDYPENLVEFVSAMPGSNFAFGNVLDTDYFCLNSQDTGINISNVACAALPTGPYYPYYSSTDPENGYGYLQEIEFNPTTTGTAVFTIDNQAESTILAYGNGSKLDLVSGPTVGYREVLICQDADGDGEYIQPTECNEGTVYVNEYDCDDTSQYAAFINHNANEACNDVNMDCSDDDSILPPNPQTVCAQAGVIPIITGVTAGGSDISTNPQVSNTVSLVVSVSDESLLGDGQTEGPNDMDRVEVLIDGSPLVSNSTDGESTYNLQFDSTSYAEGIHTLTVNAYDQLGLQSNSYEGDVNIYNSGTCDVSTITFNPTTINDSDLVDITIVGNSDCRGTTYTVDSGAISFRECNFGVCSGEVPEGAVDLESITFPQDSNELTTNAAADWFQDPDDGSNPEIVMIIDDDTEINAQSNELTVQNIAPAFTSIEVTELQESAIINYAVSEVSDVTLEYGISDYATLAGTQNDVNGGSFTIEGLDPLQTYQYRLTATDEGFMDDIETGTFTTTSFNADFDEDGDVDIFDLNTVATWFRLDSNNEEWNATIDGYDLADDDRINIVDITLVINSFYSG